MAYHRTSQTLSEQIPIVNIFPYTHTPIYIYIPEGENGNTFQYCCPKNHMDRGAWRAIVQTVTKSQMTERLSTFLYMYMHIYIYTHTQPIDSISLENTD